MGRSVPASTGQAARAFFDNSARHQMRNLRAKP